MNIHSPNPYISLCKTNVSFCRKTIIDDVLKPSPDSKASYVNRLLFAWFDPIVWRAWSKPFDESDVYDLNADDASRTIVPLWESLWARNPGLLPVIFKAFSADLFKGGAWQLAYIVFQFLAPQILNQIIGRTLYVTYGSLVN